MLGSVRAEPPPPPPSPRISLRSRPGRIHTDRQSQPPAPARRPNVARSHPEPPARSLRAAAQPEPASGSAGACAAAARRPRGATIELNSVTFEQLRAQGLSVTQATRLLAHRERVGRFQSVDELDEVPGLPQELRKT